MLQVYRLTKSFPADEKFGLTSQLRRAFGADKHRRGLQTADECRIRPLSQYCRGLAGGSRIFADGKPRSTLLAADAARPVLIEADEIAKMLHGLRSKVAKPI